MVKFYLSSFRFIKLATKPSLKPLSMLTIVAFDAHELSILAKRGNVAEHRVLFNCKKIYHFNCARVVGKLNGIRQFIF